MKMIDKRVLYGKDLDVLNSEDLERMCRRAMGIIKAWEPVLCKDDWSRPKSAGKDWKSKVDMEAQVRLDPDCQEGEMFRYVDIQEEIRSARDYDAKELMSKAKYEKVVTGKE